MQERRSTPAPPATRRRQARLRPATALSLPGRTLALAPTALVAQPRRQGTDDDDAAFTVAPCRRKPKGEAQSAAATAVQQQRPRRAERRPQLSLSQELTAPFRAHVPAAVSRARRRLAALLRCAPRVVRRPDLVDVLRPTDAAPRRARFPPTGGRRQSPWRPASARRCSRRGRGAAPPPRPLPLLARPAPSPSRRSGRRRSHGGCALRALQFEDAAAGRLGLSADR
ncbi:serine/arginine repetitive matrix protein 1-like [Schistocerca gregaria]|uniref:serine/arginine repetitive matrix protein 1-like n=1 Tax=Schistocerca gregaria TaxID=7010 RepID=UPI00211DDE3F|nr:serine/arginine repetitive matrix protein 1-like [Schistocerca gregaria]